MSANMQNEPTRRNFLKTLGIGIAGGAAAVSLGDSLFNRANIKSEQAPAAEKSKLEVAPGTPAPELLGTLAPFAVDHILDKQGRPLTSVEWYLNEAITSENDKKIVWRLVHRPLAVAYPVEQQMGKALHLEVSSEAFLRYSERRLESLLRNQSHRAFQIGDRIVCSAPRMQSSGLELPATRQYINLPLPPVTGAPFTLPFALSKEPLQLSGRLAVESPNVATSDFKRTTEMEISILEEVLSKLRTDNPNISKEELKEHLVKHSSDINSKVSTKIEGSIEVLYAAGSPESRGRTSSFLNGFVGPIMSQINTDGRIVEAMITFVRGSARSLAEALVAANTIAGQSSNASSDSRQEHEESLDVQEKENLQEKREQRQKEVKASLGWKLPLNPFSASVEGALRSSSENSTSNRTLNVEQFSKGLSQVLTNNSASTTNLVRSQEMSSSVQAKGSNQAQGKLRYVDHDGRIDNIIPFQQEVVVLSGEAEFFEILEANRLKADKAYDEQIVHKLAVQCELYENLNAARAFAITLLEIGRELGVKEINDRPKYTLPAQRAAILGFEIDPLNTLKYSEALSALKSSQTISKKRLNEMGSQEIVNEAATILFREIGKKVEAENNELSKLVGELLDVAALLHMHRGTVQIKDVDDPEALKRVVETVLTSLEDANFRLQTARNIFFEHAKSQGVIATK